MALVTHGCSFMRMRSTKVHAYSKYGFAIEKEPNKPAIPAQDGPKWRFYFSGDGEGAYPLAIVGSKHDILAALKDSRDVRFTIKAGKNDVVPDDPWDAIDDLGWPEDTKDFTYGMTIHVKAEYLQERKPLEIRDARVEAVKSVATGVATMGMAPTGPLVQLVGGIRDAAAIGIAQRDMTGGGSKQKGHLALVVSMLDLGGSLDTGRRSIAARTLRHKAKAAFAALGV